MDDMQRPDGQNQTNQVGDEQGSAEVVSVEESPRSEESLQPDEPLQPEEAQPTPVEAPAAVAPPQAPFPYGVPSSQSAGPGVATPPPAPNPPTDFGGWSAPSAPMPADATAPATSGKAIGALVCGILAILSCETVVFGIVLGIVAIVLAGSALKDRIGDGKAVAGRVCGIIGLVLSTLVLLSYLVLGAIGLAMLDYYDVGEWHEVAREVLDGHVDIEYDSDDGHAHVRIGDGSVEFSSR